jgi:nucleotide-binding universal stress UspA family protein
MNILLPFDGSPASQRAAELLAAYSGEKSRLTVVLLNVQARPFSLWPEASAVAGAIEAALLDEGKRALAPAISRFEEARIGAGAEVRLGHAAQTILREASTYDAEAIVMGTRGSGPLHGYALGSVAMRVAHGGVAPVLLVKPEDRLPAALGKRLRVLVAMDGSEPALRALDRLVQWRGWLGELEVHLVHVQRALTLFEAVLPPHDDLARQWSTDEADKATQAARERLSGAGIVHHSHLTAGNDPALELRQLAAQTSAELVALGTRGLGAVHHALVGSVALKAATAVSVPVLLVA